MPQDSERNKTDLRISIPGDSVERQKTPPDLRRRTFIGTSLATVAGLALMAMEKTERS